MQIITQRENVKKHYGKNKKFIGVIFNERSKKWRARIYISGKNMHLGTFEDEEKAGDIYNKALENINLFDGNVKEFKNKIFNL